MKKVSITVGRRIDIVMPILSDYYRGLPSAASILSDFLYFSVTRDFSFLLYTCALLTAGVRRGAVHSNLTLK